MATEEYLVFVHLIEARGLAGLYVTCRSGGRRKMWDGGAECQQSRPRVVCVQCVHIFDTCIER
jgi:hypothetical protein